MLIGSSGHWLPRRAGQGLRRSGCAAALFQLRADLSRDCRVRPAREPPGDCRAAYETDSKPTGRKRAAKQGSSERGSERTPLQAHGIRTVAEFGWHRNKLSG